MAEHVLAAVRTAPSTTELRELPMPELSDDAALLKVEVAGICGTDVKMYAKPPFADPVIMGHENVGTIARRGREVQAAARRRRGRPRLRRALRRLLQLRVVPHRRVPALRGHRLADQPRRPPLRLHLVGEPRHLWGGFSQYMYLPWNAVLHKVPDGVTAELAGLVTPLSNGIEWALFAAGVGYAATVLIQGPGQQGLSQVVACKQAGASKIIVTGTTRDKARLDLALDARRRRRHRRRAGRARCERVMDLTGGRGVDFVLDCTSRAGVGPVLLGIDALKRREGTLLIQGELAAFPDFPIKKLTEKAITIKSARGHSYRACELALAAARLGPLPAGAADHPQVRPRPGRPRDPGARRRDRGRRRHPHLADALARKGRLTVSIVVRNPPPSRPGRPRRARRSTGWPPSTRRRAAPACSRPT